MNISLNQLDVRAENANEYSHSSCFIASSIGERLFGCASSLEQWNKSGNFCGNLKRRYSEEFNLVILKTFHATVISFVCIVC